MKVGRRRFLRDLLGASGAAVAAEAAAAAPERSGIEHIVVVMMENRSFDHLLGWLPNARGRQARLTYLDAAGVPHRTHRLRSSWKGCGHPDPNHSYGGGRAQYNGGAMDGFLRSGANDEYAIGYYRESDRPFLGALARHYTTLDHYFCSILGPTFPNRIFLHAGQTDRTSNTRTRCALPTIWDRLLEAGVSAGYYYSNLPTLGFWGLKYRALAASVDAFLADAASGALPAVSFVDPRFTLVSAAFSNDDHPHADIRAGDAFLSTVFQALAGGPGWPGTVLVITYDEWGGFFDHVPPPRVIAPNEVDTDIVDGKVLLGFRVPVVVASPFTRGDPAFPRVSHARFDHTSVLKLIEWRFGLEPLGARDASREVGNLASVLRLGQPRPEVPPLPAPGPPRPRFCDEGEGPRHEQDADDTWAPLLASGMLEGWPLY
jgi:phospholipase C